MCSLSWVKANPKKVGVAFRLFALVACIWFLKCKLPSPSQGTINQIHSRISLASLEAGIFISMAISGVVYVALTFGIVAKLLSTGTDPVVQKLKDSGKRVLFGIICGSLTFVGSFFFLFLFRDLTEQALIWLSLFLAFMVIIIDLLLGKRDVVEFLDVPVFVTMLLVVGGDAYLSSLYKSPLLHSGFTCGSVAFQLLLANLSFDPAAYWPAKVAEGLS
jgi:hypothetical protein